MMFDYLQVFERDSLLAWNDFLLHKKTPRFDTAAKSVDSFPLMSIGSGGNTKDLIIQAVSHMKAFWLQGEFCRKKHSRIKFEDEKLLQISNIFILIQSFAALNHTGFP